MRKDSLVVLAEVPVQACTRPLAIRGETAGSPPARRAACEASEAGTRLTRLKQTNGEPATQDPKYL